MPRSAQFVIAAAAALTLATLPFVPAAGAVAGASAGTWGNAIEVPGSMKLNAGNDANFDTVSCGAAGNCAAGGSYTDVKGNVQDFIVNQRNGRWSRAMMVKGTVSTGHFAAVASVSCTAAGDCTAGGYYSTIAHGRQAFVITERNGLWGAATKVPGLTTLDKGGLAEADLVSCTSPGNCGLIGTYLDAAHNEEWFAVSQRSGSWGVARQLRGTGTNSIITSMSCGAIGDCAATGFRSNDDPIVISERDGHWASAISVPGLATLDTGGFAEVPSVSCPAAGTCTAVGSYATGSNRNEPFVVTEKHGRWNRAFELPQTAALPGSGNQHAVLFLVSCAAVGDCSVAGTDDVSLQQQVFVADEQNGRWGKPTQLPGLAALNAGGVADVTSLSCAASGDCALGGSYLDVSKDTVAYVASEQNGRWSKAIEVPGNSLLNNGSFSLVQSMSCKAPGRCSAGGYYFNGEGLAQVFVVSQS